MNDISHKDWRAMSDDGIAHHIGEFVKYYRKEQRITQQSLAQDAGISRSTLSLLEGGESVTVTSLIRVLRILDRLDVFNGCSIINQPSPLLLAKTKKKKRKRIVPPRKKEKPVDW
jgi:transcriptional regulator with XRE-family HTH domain